MKTPTQLIAGTWSLESFELGAFQSSRPWGTNLVGLLIYTPDGYVSVGINRNISQSSFNVEEDSLFYAGTYKVISSQIVHHIQVATNAERINQEMIRQFELSGDILTLKGTSNSGEEFCLRWRKKV